MVTPQPPFLSACGRLSHIQSLSGSGKDNLTISALLRNPLITSDGLVLISLSTDFWGLGPIRKKGHELDTQPNSVNSHFGNAQKGHILCVRLSVITCSQIFLGLGVKNLVVQPTCYTQGHLSPSFPVFTYLTTSLLLIFRPVRP